MYEKKLFSNRTEKPQRQCAHNGNQHINILKNHNKVRFFYLIYQIRMRVSHQCKNEKTNDPTKCVCMIDVRISAANKINLFGFLVENLFE